MPSVMNNNHHSPSTVKIWAMDRTQPDDYSLFVVAAVAVADVVEVMDGAVKKVRMVSSSFRLI